MILSIARRLIYPGLAAKIEPYRVTRDEEMQNKFREGGVMKLILAALFALLPMGVQASWTGHLDLQSSVQPLALREIHDGQWLAGYAHPNLFHIDHNGNPIFHLGVFHAFNAEGGNASFGPLAGVDLMGISREVGVDVPALLGNLGEWTGAPSVFKPASYFVNLLSVDFFGGYRPVHTDDVLGNWIYGVGATLKIPFGVKELRAGL